MLENDNDFRFKSGSSFEPRGHFVQQLIDKRDKQISELRAIADGLSEALNTSNRFEPAHAEAVSDYKQWLTSNPVDL